MRDGRFTGVSCALLTAALALAVTGCQRTGPQDGRIDGGAAATRASGYGAVFLGADECSSFGRETFTEVPCDGERAAARVVARHGGGAADGPACPATTDFVLHIGEQRLAGGGRDRSGEDGGGGTIPQGYACMRRLQPPHPGDPGGGGGPRTIAGDCVRRTGAGEVRETACDGTGRERPDHKVVSAVGRRADCPPATTLYVRLGGAGPVGCARPV
ncbi:hypothetical protein [Streptomyces minutiscleroticus]|uniref:Lipoprotein n=1 Tax=Streptomyces minutiscleroticus TaxID=68238 RepID=A0A918KI05_9ACTN|nr:hypothetical protein [Streptomyces minutiscleroticus]GGX64320.1 hypothetical protein GCM10010358_18210 [Streptomyces minutiscleroticus]